MKIENAVVIEARTTMEEESMRLKSDDNVIQLDGERIKQE